MNVASYFEIPVSDLERAICSMVLFSIMSLNESLPTETRWRFSRTIRGIQGSADALAQVESYVPGKSGVRIYFGVPDIQVVLKRAVAAGGKMFYPESAVGAFGCVAEIEDLGGNCIGLHSPLASAS